ncbi:hypothetical protein ACFE04_030193 [Oxalis oulophora]
MASKLMKLVHGATIRIFRNLRICGVSSAFKFISKVVQREILVRNTRFHHFRHGKSFVHGYYCTNLHNKEISIRKRIANIFNKREDDFPSLKEYNDYLEQVEDMTFNLIQGIDVQAIEEKNITAEELAAALAATKAQPAQVQTDGEVVQSLETLNGLFRNGKNREQS